MVRGASLTSDLVLVPGLNLISLPDLPTDPRIPGRSMTRRTRRGAISPRSIPRSDFGSTSPSPRFCQPPGRHPSPLPCDSAPVGT
jgi:hypothetical protein